MVFIEYPGEYKDTNNTLGDSKVHDPFSVPVPVPVSSEFILAEKKHPSWKIEITLLSLLVGYDRI